MVNRSMPAAASPRYRSDYPRSNLQAFLAMRSSFVFTDSPRLGTDGMSSLRSTICRLLPSSGITRLHRYYETIRLPTRDELRLPYFGRWSPLPSMEARAGPPGLPCSHIVMHAMVSDPGEANAVRASLNRVHVGFRILNCVALPIYEHFGAQSLQPYGLRPTCLLSYA